MKRVLRWLIAAGLGLMLLPVFLTLLYTVVTPVSTPMIGRWLTGERVTRTPVSIDRVARAVPVGVIASEDGQFCRHWGVDWRELREILQEEGGPSRGASTVPMQVARNLFLWGGDTGFTAIIRKGLEIPLALMIDLVWSKRRMMEIYLNIAEWGPDGEFGIEAGARAAFSKPAASLTPREAALLVAILPNPGERFADEPSARVRAKAAIVQRRSNAAIAGCLG